ncbi:MAG: zinc-ribbon domain-containing protein [Porcipelethomonas sp.]
MVCKSCGNKVYAGEICSCGERVDVPHRKGVAVNTVICTIVLVMSVIALILTASFVNIVKKDMLIDTIEKVNIAELEVKDGSGEKVRLDKYIYDNFVDDDRITVENVNNVLSDPFIKDFLIEKIDGYQKFFTAEGDMVYITSDDIINLIDENSTLLYNEAGLNFLEPDKEELRDSLSGLDSFSDFCRNYLTGWFTGGLIQTYFSFPFVCFLGALLVVIMVQWLAVYRLNGRRMIKVLKKYGIAVIVPSAVFFAASVSLLFAGDNSVLGALTSKVKLPFMLYSGIALAVGVLLLAAYLVFGRRKTVPAAEGKAGAAPEADVPAVSVTDMTGSADIIPDSLFAPAAAGAEKKDEDAQTKAEDKKENAVTAAEPGQDSTGAKAENKPDTEKAVFCTQCGHKNRENSSFCAKCGTKLRKKQ